MPDNAPSTCEPAPRNVSLDSSGIDYLRTRIDMTLARKKRALIGVCGAPGSGKSFVCERLGDLLGLSALTVPMDGFHLARDVIKKQGTLSRRGAAFTFDSWGFVSLVKRITEGVDPVVYAPSFVRSLHESIACAIPIPNSAPFVVFEGNYLLLDSQPWDQLKSLLDEIWYLDLEDSIRLQRLSDRHVQYGRTPEAAQAHILGSDELNGDLIKQTRNRADVIIDVTPFNPADNS